MPDDAAGVRAGAGPNHPAGRIEGLEEVRLEDFEAMRRGFDRQQAGKRQKTAVPVRPAPAEGARDASRVGGYLGPWAGAGAAAPAGPSEAEMHAFLAQKEAATVRVETQATIEPGQESSIFHGPAERDYLGRSYMVPPQDLGLRLDKEAGSFECWAPKRLVHTWVGHTRGVTAIRFVPVSGHLLLSGSQDTRVKLWDVHRDRQCLRTFLGHNKPVRDVNFDGSGGRFVSAGYDRRLNYWDTETGRLVTGIQHSSIPFCAKFHPEQPDILLAGCADKKIWQWDLRSGEAVLEYNQHLDAVNSITFLEGGRRFASTSDDKTIRVWDYGTPVTVKHCAEADMHSMPCAAVHPGGEQMVFQSLDNRVVTYACAADSFKQRGRKFGGHSTAGWACNVGFSPDGRFLLSGDGRGALVIWDWKTGQMVRRVEAHTKVCIDVQWNPQEASRVATCSWDGTIKYWD